MGLTRLRNLLQRHRRIFLDTSVFIYHVESNPHYAGFTEYIFAWLAGPGHTAVTSTITLTELLVKPYRDSAAQRVNEFCALLVTYPNLDWIAPGFEIADIAARIRVRHRLRTSDALQAATAMHAGATALISNDPVFERVGALETLLLDQLM